MRKLILGMAVILATQVGCGDTYIGGPTVINTNTNGGPTTPTSPTPGTGGNGLITLVKIGEVGEQCSPGQKPAEDENRVIGKGCRSFVTCSPKGADGKDVPISVSGQAPDSFGVISGSQFVRFATWSDNGFNADITGTEVGPFTLECIVKGLSSGPVVWNVLAPQAASVGEPSEAGAYARPAEDRLVIQDFPPQH